MNGQSVRPGRVSRKGRRSPSLGLAVVTVSEAGPTRGFMVSDRLGLLRARYRQ